MGWTGCPTNARSLKAAFEEQSCTMARGLDLSAAYNPHLTEDIRFVIADYRIQGRKLTLLLQNAKYPDHREIACFLIDLNREYGEFLYKDLSFCDSFTAGFPMLETWAKALLAKRGGCDAADAGTRGRFREFSRYLAEGKYRAVSERG